MSGDGRAGLMPPPMHPLHPSAPPSPAARSTSSLAPPLPPRPGSSSSNVHIDVDQGSSAESDSDSGSGFEFVPVNRPITPNLGAGPSTESVLSTKEEEELSEVQLRELYDDEEIDRFLYLFSTVSSLPCMLAFLCGIFGVLNDVEYHNSMFGRSASPNRHHPLLAMLR